MTYTDMDENGRCRRIVAVGPKSHGLSRSTMEGMARRSLAKETGLVWPTARVTWSTGHNREARFCYASAEVAHG